MSDTPPVATSCYGYTPELGARDARTIARIFTNDTRCGKCASGAVWVVYCPGCSAYRGPHFHRECQRCAARWAERSWGHAGVDIRLDDPRFVALCRCGARHDHRSCMTPRCCARPQVEYHDTAAPCDDCRAFGR